MGRWVPSVRAQDPATRATGVRVFAEGLEAQCEALIVAHVHEDAVFQNVAADQSLNRLTLQRCFDHGRLVNEALRQQQPHEVLVAKVGLRRRRRRNRDHAGRLQAELCDKSLLDACAVSAGVDHRIHLDGRRSSDPRRQTVDDSLRHGERKFEDRTERFQVR